MKEQDNREYDLLQYKKFESMRLRSIWKEHDLIEFADDIIIPLLEGNYKTSKIRDVLKFPQDIDLDDNFKKYLEVIEVALQFAISYGHNENKRYRYLFDNPPNMPKKKISDKATLDVLKKCCKLYRERPNLKQTVIMEKVADNNFNWTTLRNAFRQDLECSPKKIISLLELFGLEDEKIEIFYKNYLKIRGY